MSLLLGETVPDFEAETTEGHIRFYEFLGDSWGMLFSHPADFTPVCTTELGAVAKLKPEFDRRNTKVIGLSVDPLEAHKDWLDDIEQTQGAAINFPIIADSDHAVANLYGMIHAMAWSHPQQPEYVRTHELDTATVRTVFIIAPDKTLRLTLTYPPSTGRSFQEILRVLDSLQLTESAQVATPADWSPGDDVVILPGISDEDARVLFPEGFQTHRPYLRTTPAPRP